MIWPKDTNKMTEASPEIHEWPNVKMKNAGRPAAGGRAGGRTLVMPWDSLPSGFDSLPSGFRDADFNLGLWPALNNS